jgi:hypothetical protein
MFFKEDIFKQLLPIARTIMSFTRSVAYDFQPQRSSRVCWLENLRRSDQAELLQSRERLFTLRIGFAPIYEKSHEQ